MINVSNEFKKQLANDNRNYLEYADITLKDGTVLNLTNKNLWNGGLSIEDAVSSDSSFAVGSAIINKSTLTINNIYDDFSDYVFEDAEAVTYVGLPLDEVDETVGENILINSNFVDGKNHWIGANGTSQVLVTIDNKTVMKVDPSTSSVGNGGSVQKINKIELDAKYTFSTQIYTNEEVIARLAAWYDDSGWKVIYYKDFNLQVGWNNVSITFTSSSIKDNLIVGVVVKKGNIIYFYHPKLEKGNVATGWTIAPEDVRIEKIRKGTYAVDEPSYNGSIITLSCLDNMRKFDRAYSESKLAYPATLNAIVRDACSVCGVTLQTVSFPHDDFVVQTRPTDEAITFREVISWSAQIAGCFCRCDVYGRLGLKWYDQTALENPKVVDWSAENPTGTENAHWIKSNYSAPVVSMDDVVITGVRVVEKNEREDTQEQLTTYQSGTDGYVISIENNELIKGGTGQTVAGWLGEQLIGVKFRKATVNHASDPTIEAGDIAVVTDRKGNNYNIVVSSTKFSTGSSQNTVSAAENPARNSAARYSAATKNYVEWRKAIEKEKTEREKALEELGERLENSSGVFTTVEMQSDGSKVYYLHNKPNLSESDMIWKMTAEAWGVSTDGGKTWNAGMTVDGDTIVRILTATGVNANWINAGAISVKDDSGNTIFFVDMDTKQVIISGDSVRIGGKTATTAINEALEEARKSRNMNIILDNEYQGIPADYEGNIAVFPTVKTFVQVLYGHTDVSVDCSYSVTKSAGVTGKWDVATRTYTVTSLTADTGWVDITASYLSLFTTTKRFNVAKIKGGNPGEDGIPGEPGRTYFIESSSNVLKRSKDNTISPNFIEFKAYYRDGTSANRTAYSGRFIVEETADGNTWKTIYTSPTNESSVKHYLYSMLSNTSGNVISTANGSAIGIPRDVVSVRCRLYESGGTTNLMDMQSVAVVVDVDALTAEQVLEILSGGWQGIYSAGDKYYISAEFIKAGEMLADRIRGGTLTLGGLNNANGTLKILDSSGNQIGKWDKDGIQATNGTFSGELSGAKGTFEGTVSAGIVEGSTIIGSSINTESAEDGRKIYMSDGKIEFYVFTYTKPAGYIVAGTGENEAGVNCLCIYGMQDSLAMQFIGQHSMAMGNMHIKGNGTIDGSLTVGGKGHKSKIVDTLNYGTRTLYCYETPTPLFGDVGIGKTDENGVCYVEIDDIFSETVRTDVEYFVFLQKEGEGDLWVDLKESTFFVVKGTPNLSFSWEIKSVQKDFETLRLDEHDADYDTSESDELERMYEQEIKKYNQEMEALYNDQIAY